ncbi:MAG: DUF1800 domain-containing protein [Acidobacteria bacterium]|nr:DUF1800 domain-containing protein [Acidobacteriota bacterium]
MILVCASLSAARNLPGMPVLVSEEASTRALTANPNLWRSNRLPLAAQVAWPAGTDARVVIFVTNLNLMAGEGANAFRADAQNAAGRRYDLPVESLFALPGMDWVYAVTIRLNPELGDVGDVLVRINWRGMASNRVRLPVGHLGGGPPDDEGATPTPAPLVRPKVVEPVEYRGGEEQGRLLSPFSPDAIRFLEQATFGPNNEAELHLRRVGIRRWIEEQTTQKFDASGNARYSTLPYPTLPLQPTVIPTSCNAACQRDNYTMYKLQNWMFQEALYSDDQQLRRRVAWALSQILVVSGRDTQQASHMLAYLKVLDRNAFGNFRDLLYEITLNPAMGNYLDMVRSTGNDPNENYAREILQLFSVGLNMLKKDGSPKLDAQGNRIPTYTQDTVNNFTKVFTGWNFCNSGCSSSVPGLVNYLDPLIANPALHDTTQKTLLNYPGAIATIPAGLTPDEDLNLALDNIFYHPNVAPFISKALIQQLVTSNPSGAYIQRVATVFENNGQGVRGDLRAVVTAILLDPEARGDIKTDPDYGKLREPILFVTSVLRPFDPRAINRTIISDGVINGITQPLDQDVFNAPSVFNYFPPDYIVPNTSVVGPEYAILTTGTALKRPNFVNQMVFTAGITVNATANITAGTSISMASMQALAAADSTGGLLVDQLNRLMMHGSMSTAMRNSILQAVQAVSTANTLKRAQTAVYLIATSSQYEVQR